MAGYWAGYSEYRYGSERSVPTSRPILKGEQRKHVIDRVMDELRDWRSCHFEHQGACVTGLRSALCIQGYGWGRADFEANAIVSESLRKLGAKIPSWDEGQREYLIPRENCKWCSNPIPDEDRQGKRDPRYCSPVCAKAALQYRFAENQWWRHAKGWAAYRILDRLKQPERICAQCGRSFHIKRKGSEAEYCSQRCHQKSRRIIPERSCLECGTSFRPGSQRDIGLFCSVACRRQNEAAAKIEKRCDHCGELFKAKTAKARFCRKSHYLAYWKAQRTMEAKDKSSVVYLTPAVFDMFFLRAA